MAVRALLRRARQDDSGAVLVVALLVLLVFSLILGALLTNGSTSQKNTPVARNHLSKVYAADAGIDAGISKIRKDAQYCATQTNPAADIVLPDLANGRSVTVKCSVLSSSSTTGAAGYAVVLTSKDPNSLVTALGADKSITGPVFMSGGMQNQQVVAVHDGDLDHLCGGTTTAPSTADMTFDTGYGYAAACKTLPVVDHQLPGSGSCGGTCGPIPSASDTSCVIFKPGRYTSPPALVSGQINYFASGVYFFDNVGAIAIKQQVITAGRPTDPQTATCATAANDAQVGATGRGATFVFGGDSYMDFDADAHLEIFERVPAGGSATPGLSVVALPSTESDQGYGLSTVTGELFRPKDGNTPDFVIHGLVYAPEAQLTVNATGTVRSQLRGGVVVSKLRIEASSSAANIFIGITIRPGDRRVRLTSTADASTRNGVPDGGKNIVSVAVVDVASQPGFPVQVKSWRSTAPDF